MISYLARVINVILGCIVVATIVLWGHRRRHLTRSGAVAACLVGGCVWIGARWGLVTPLLFFFIASSVITHWSARQRGATIASVARKTARDAWQVGANGSITAACALLGLVTGDGRWLYAGLCALAAMTGDTWSAEIGKALARWPLDLRSFRRVEAGISGAVSLIGTLAGLAGALLTTIIGVALLPRFGHSAGSIILLIAVWSFLAGWVDSILGATIQMRFRCRECGILTDHETHCGEPAERIAGVARVDNSSVNLLTTIFAALGALFL